MFESAYRIYINLIPALLILIESLLLRYIFESPRFLLTNRINVEAATEVMEKIFLINGKGNFAYKLVSENLKINDTANLRDIFQSKLIKIQLTAFGAIWLYTYIGSNGCFLIHISAIIY